MKKIKRLLKIITAFICLLVIPSVQVYANPCYAPTCGCGARGTAVCYAGMTCWYTDYDGCVGHNWYLYEATGATCTSGGRIVFKCSICPGERVFWTPALGHDWTGWVCVDSSRHMRTCRRCGITQYEGHMISGWHSSGGGNYSRDCSRCTYSQEKGLFISASASTWTAGEAVINVSGYDGADGCAGITLYRTNCITGVQTLIGDFDHHGAHDWPADTFSQEDEGIFYYTAVMTDMAGHSVQASTGRVYVDHSAPVIIGAENTESDWINVAPVISVRSTDYLYGTSVTGSGIRSVKIYDDNDIEVARGDETASYTLEDRYEGEHVFRIEARDNVGHVSEMYVTTRYDITPPGMEGTESTFVTDEGEVISGYCQDNIIFQHIDDECGRSINEANSSSGLRNVILYKVTGNDMEAIYADATYRRFEYPDPHTFFDVYYDINETQDNVDYYLIIVEDFAGNRIRKKLTSQRTLLTMFHTSIDRGSY